MKNTLRALGISLLALSASLPAQAAGPSGLEVINRLPGPDGTWDLLAVDQDARRLYVAHSSVVTAVDLDSGTVTPALVHGVRLHGVVPLKGTGNVAVVSGTDNTVIIFEGASGKVLGTVSTGGKDADAIAQDPATGLLYVMNHDSGDIGIIDPAALKLIGTIVVGGALELTTVDGKGRLYVNVEDKNEVVAVDLATRKVAARIPLKGCEAPTGIAYDPHSDLLVSACDGVAAVVNGRTGKHVATITTGDGADTVMFDAAHNQFLVPNGASGTLSVIAEDPNGGVKLIDSVKTQISARTGALDTKTGHVYLPAAKLMPAVGGGRPTPAPGTFEILVLGR